MINVRKVQESLGKSLTDCLLFAHSVSGCYTTSSFYGIGKLKAVKLVKESKVLQQKIKVSGEDNASQEQLCEAGEQFILATYQGGISSIQ